MRIVRDVFREYLCNIDPNCRPLSDNPNEEQLVVEVWQCGNADMDCKKTNKSTDAKGVSGSFSKLTVMEENPVAVASNGDPDQELIGNVTISLKVIEYYYL